MFYKKHVKVLLEMLIHFTYLYVVTCEALLWFNEWCIVDERRNHSNHIASNWTNWMEARRDQIQEE